MYKIILIILSSLYLTGCVSPIKFEQQIPTANYVEKEKVLISVVDERKKVKAGKNKTFIGVAHSSFGIPVDWHVNNVLATEKEDKGKNLSDWLEHRITSGLNQNGWNTEKVDLDNHEDANAVNELLKESDAVKLIKLTLYEWYFSINLNWVSAFNFDTDTAIEVFEVDEGQLLSKRITERDVVEESAKESPQNNVLRAYREQLKQILNDPELKKSLEK